MKYILIATAIIVFIIITYKLQSTEEPVIPKANKIKAIHNTIIKNQLEITQKEQPIVEGSEHMENKSLGESPMAMPIDTVDINARYSDLYFPPVRELDFAATIIHV